MAVPLELADSGAAQFPLLKRVDVERCCFSSWYPLFRAHSPRATVIKPLPPAFREYLEAGDGLFLPEGSHEMGISGLSDSDDDSDAGDQGNSDDEDDRPKFSFPELDAEIRSVLHKYEGAVFPKLNWTSPQDAAWMIPGHNLKCQSPADVYLLLKSSDFMTHDLDHAYDACQDGDAAGISSTASTQTDLSAATEQLELSDRSPDPETNEQERDSSLDLELVLKKWYDIPKSQEWRCFVRERQLLGICHRDTNFYDFLQPPSAREQIRDQIVAFFHGVIKPKFPGENYVVDLYLTRDASRLFIIDFNVYTEATDSLLFSWSHLNSISISPMSVRPAPEIRVVYNEAQASQAMPRFSHNRYPKEMVQMSEGQSVADFAREWAGKLAEGVHETLAEESDEDGNDAGAPHRESRHNVGSSDIAGR